MRFHPIFYKPYQIWWLILGIICFIKFFIIGFPNTFNGKYGYFFYVFGSLLSGLLYGSILYLIYWLFSRKWNNKVYIILISIATIFGLFFIYK